MRYALETHNLTKRYGQKYAIKDLSLHVPEKSIYGFLGANGAGKTTTFGVLGGFIRASAGTFAVEGRLALLPQDARFYYGRTLLDQLMFLAGLSGVPAHNRKKEVQKVLDQVDLADKAKLKAEKMSHGMYKRLGIAQALLGEPDVILLDEPTAGLDPKVAHGIRSLITSLGGERTIVISSHNLHEISEMCSHVGVIHEGEMKYEGEVSGLTKSNSSITYHVSDEVEVTVLKQSDWVGNIVKKHMQLEVHFDTSKKTIEEANRELLQILLEKNVGIREVTIGQSLEEGFLELVGKES